MKTNMDRRLRRVGAVVALVAGLLAGAAAAQEAAAPAAGPAAEPESSAPTLEAGAAGDGVSPWRLGVALGYGRRTNPVIQSEDIPVVVDLDIAWFGDRFFFDNGDAGVTLADNSVATVNLIGRVNSDRVFFGKTNTRLVQVGGSGTTAGSQTPPDPVTISVPDRDYAVELGFEALLDGRWGMLQLDAHRDVSDTHGGYEIFADYAFGWRRQRLLVQPSVGFSFKSAALNDYYWGVRPGEASELLPVYQAGSGTNPHAKLLVSFQVTRNWAVAGAVEYERLNAEAAASPIAQESDVLGYFVGMSYGF
jgi:MipA family protein